jgi:hypothetical protein
LELEFRPTADALGTVLLQGDFLPAADVDFYIDMDPTSGEEMVTVEEAKQIGRQGVLLLVPDAARSQSALPAELLLAPLLGLLHLF